jgi:pimeloyl-ACP methyl ester carboxylesterase
MESGVLKVVRIGLKIIVGLVAVLATILAVSGLAYSRYMKIDLARGLNESGYVRVGGIDQWVQIRGDDRSNPVLLLLNGGPGASTIPSTSLFRSWEKQFTVVMWDQRGEGRTFENGGPHGSEPMTIQRMVEDGIELSQYLRSHLHKQKIVILGHSWGSILGVRMVKEHPELFAAYVGTGQVTNMQTDIAAAYPSLRVLAESRRNTSALRDLNALGPPPYESLQKDLSVILWANALDAEAYKGSNIVYVPWGLATWLVTQRVYSSGAEYSGRVLSEPLSHVDLLSLGTKFDVPVVIIQGSDDLVTVTALAKDYFDGISAPHKDFVLLQGHGHFAVYKDSDVFLAAVAAHVLPLLTHSGASGGS